MISIEYEKLISDKEKNSSTKLVHAEISDETEEVDVVHKPTNGFAGFKIGQEKAVGCFTATERQKLENDELEQGEEPNFHDSAKMTDKEYIEGLIEQNKENYSNKYGFD